MPQRRVRIVERLAGHLQLRFDAAVNPNTKLIVGREGDVTIGADPLDSRVSRHSLAVTTHGRGWEIVPTNRNGVMLHLWAQSPRSLTKPESIVWPRIGLRVVGHPDIEHWVLLEDDEVYTLAAARHTTGFTELGDPPRQLRPAHLEVLRLLFTDILAWPPSTTPTVRQLKQVASGIDRSISAVQNRLIEVLTTAKALGLTRDVSLTDPEYVYLLVRAGYIVPDRSEVDELLRLA